MRTLSPKTEEQLIGALKTAVALVDDEGYSPDDAMSKVAQDGQWGPEMIRFGCQAYNTGRQTAQRENNDTILEKLGTFPLADPDKVISEVFPSKVKTASDIYRETAVSDEYSHGPDFLLSREKQARMAAADKIWFAPVEHPVNAPDPTIKMAKAHSNFVELQKAAEEARHQKDLAFENLLKAAGALGEYFKQHPNDRIKFAEFEKLCDVFYPGTKKIRDYVYNRNGMKEARANDKTQVPRMTIARDQAPWSLVKAAVDSAKSTFEKRSAHDNAVEAMDKFASTDIRPYALIPKDDPGEWTLLGNVNAKSASLMTGALGGALSSRAGKSFSNSLQSPSTEERISDRVLDLEDPDHDAELKKIQIQAMLAELMGNDEVISGYPPEQVSDAFNEISQLAPRAATQPMAIRALLRRQLQGNIEPFEVKDTADLESSVMKTEGGMETDSPLTVGGPMKKDKPEVFQLKQSETHWLLKRNDSII